MSLSDTTPPTTTTPAPSTHTPPSTHASTTNHTTFDFPPHYTFPPFYTLQPNLTTRASQLASWSALLLAYCAHSRLFHLSPTHAIFTNARLRRTLASDDARAVLAHMVSKGSASWVSVRKGVEDAEAGAWVWWKSVEGWGAAIGAWVEETGQRGRVLTVYELHSGDGTAAQEFHGMPEEAMRVVLVNMQRRGKCSVFGEGGAEGVKIY